MSKPMTARTVVRELRRQQGLAVDALAYKAGVSTRTLVLWERYGLPPRNRQTLEKIANALGVRPEDLLPELHEGGERQP